MPRLSGDGHDYGGRAASTQLLGLGRCHIKTFDSRKARRVAIDATRHYYDTPPGARRRCLRQRFGAEAGDEIRHFYSNLHAACRGDGSDTFDSRRQIS